MSSVVPLCDMDAGGFSVFGGVNLIPSEARLAVIPSEPAQSQTTPIRLVPSQALPPGLIPSQPAPSPSTLFSNPSAPPPPLSLIPSAPLTAGPGLIPSAPAAPNATPTSNSSRMDTTRSPVMISTDQGLHPIPPAATKPGDPNGHHEITEPNFSATKSCPACSPVFEATATGCMDIPPEPQQGTSSQHIVTKVSAGPSHIATIQAQSGGNFVIGDSIPVTPGQTIPVDDVPLALQTVIISLQPSSETTSNKGPRATYAPSQLPPLLTVGTEIFTANQQAQYFLSGQTLSPAGEGITMAGTTISLMPSATAVVINGATSSLAPRLGNTWTTAAPALTFNSHVYTANRAGYITIGPGTVLRPGIAAITVDGTTMSSLEQSGTSVVIQGITSILKPVRTIVTLTRSVPLGGIGGGDVGYTSGGTWCSPTSKPAVPAKPISVGHSFKLKYSHSDGWVGGSIFEMTSTAKRDSRDASADELYMKVQSIDLSKPTPRKRSIGLVELPAPVRNNIYKYALDTELVNVGESNVSYTHSIKDGVLQFKASRSPFSVLTELFYINKLISKEALHYFYSKNLFVKFEIYSSEARHAKTMLLDSGVLFSPTSPTLLQNAKHHALDLILVEKNSSQKRAAVMFPAQYLPRLISFLHQASQTTKSWAPAHSIFINLLNTYEFPVSRLQGDLLELFRMLSNLGGATVDPNHLLPRYAESLQANMTAPSFSPDNWLQIITELADLSDSVRDKEDYRTANEYSQTVIIALTYGYLTQPEALHSQPEAFHKSVQRLRWRTELGVGIALSLLHRDFISSNKNWLLDTPSHNHITTARDLLLAEAAHSRALSLSTDSPSPSSNPWFLSLPVELIPPNKLAWFTDLERAQTWYALGTVHAALGENLFAAGDMERAIELWGTEDGKEKVDAAFEKIRHAIDEQTESMWKGRIKPGGGLNQAGKIARLQLS
ncbi:hypothetical protein ACEQ8H_005910 [Pleosporales sp. CAS-2024a]